MSEADFKRFVEREGFALPDHFEPNGMVQRIKKADAIYCDKRDVGALIVADDDMRPFGDVGAVNDLLESSEERAKHLEAHISSKQLAVAESADAVFLKETAMPTYDKPFFPDVKVMQSGAARVLKERAIKSAN